MEKQLLEKTHLPRALGFYIPCFNNLPGKILGDTGWHRTSYIYIFQSQSSVPVHTRTNTDGVSGIGGRLLSHTYYMHNCSPRPHFSFIVDIAYTR
jgi:hypothetical protein